MIAKTRKFADDGWGIWIDGDDRSTIYLNEWLNPKGKSYVDIGVRIYGAKSANDLCIYVPFRIKERGTLDILIQAARNRNAARYPIQSFVTNRLTI